jgi:membrane-associated protease RseP (regulator of RpoE activity)
MSSTTTAPAPLPSPEVPPSSPLGVPAPPAGPAAKSPKRAAFEVIVVAGAVTILAVATGWGDLLIVVACLVAMVMMHELGHLLAAKRGGMKVTAYFLGFGPRLWSFRHGETEYGIKALPLGGYVKIPGMTNLEEVDPADESRTYRQQPFHARLLVAVAGSAMHFLMAFVLLWALVAFVGLSNDNQLQIQTVNSVGGKPGPAQVAGLRTGDILVSVDGRPVHGDFNQFESTVLRHPGSPVHLVVQRNGHDQEITVVPANGRVEHESGVAAPTGSAPFGVVGVSVTPPTQRTNPFGAVPRAITVLGQVSWASIVGVGHLFSPSGLSALSHEVTSAKAANQAAANGTRPESIVGAARTAVQAAQAGVGDLILILVSINVFVGILNLFPMLPFDGGHVAIAVYERIRSGRRSVAYHADVAKMLPYTYLMVAFLGILVTTLLLNDLIHPMANPFG